MDQDAMDILHSRLPKLRSKSVPRAGPARPSLEASISVRAYRDTKYPKPSAKIERGNLLSLRTIPIKTTDKIPAERAFISRRHSAPTRGTSPRLGVSPQSSSIFRRINSFVSSLFEPKYVRKEYSNSRMTRRTTSCIKAKWVLYTSRNETKRMLHMILEVKNEDGLVQTMDLVAQHKRVKEILINAGEGYVAEELHRDKIIKALHLLKEADERKKLAGS